MNRLWSPNVIGFAALTAWLWAQDAPVDATGVQVIEWIFKAGLPGFFGYGWWDATRERRAVQQKNDDRQERMIPVFTEFTGVLRELKEIVLERRESEKGQAPNAEVLEQLTKKLDKLADDMRPGGRDDTPNPRRRG